MKNKLPRPPVALTTALLIAVSAASAQQVAPAAPDAATLNRYDRNRNGVLDADETAAMNADQQRAAAATTSSTASVDEEVVELTPFEVSADADVGYAATTTLAGNRLRTDLRDIGNAVSVITAQFLKDIGATNNETLLQYTAGTEVGNIQGNYTGVGDGALLNETDRFKNPNQNTRVRGLAEADNTRDYFLTDTPWDGYNIDRVDLSRGPNSILFGLGSPAGIINTSTKQARFANSGEVEARFGSFYSNRFSLDINRELIDNELALRIAAVRDDEKFKQEPSFDLDRRIYGALRYEPAFLKRSWGRTVIRANAEAGKVRSNRPRSLPPIDLITPWFESGAYQGRFTANGTIRDPATGQVMTVTAGQARTFNNLNRATFNPFQLQDDNTGLPNHGQQRPGINGGADSGRINPYFQPWIGNFAQSFGGPLAYFSGDQAGPPTYVLQELRTTRGIGPTGAVDGNLAVAFHRQGGVNLYANFARLAGLPFSEFGVYRHKQLTDPSVYDFYENLIDGNNKKEWQNFRSYNLSLTQTFFNDRVGIDGTYYNERYRNGQLSFITDGRQSLNIDFMSVYSDGTPAGLNGEPFQDGTPNPNVGRPFISDSGQFGNNSTYNQRESGRATVYGMHNFARRTDNFFLRALGRHTVTGLYSQDSLHRDQREWQRWAILDPAYRTFIGAPSSTRFTDNLLAPNPVIYLGPSLLNRSTASGANIPRPMEIFAPVSGTVRAFDSTWANRPGIDPAAPWENEYYPVGSGSRASTQSENPANYVGWVNFPFTVTDAETSQANKDLLTTLARLTRKRTVSRALVWQGNLLDNSIVTTLGWRRDIDKSWTFERRAANAPGFGHIDLGPTYALGEDPDARLDISSRSHSIVVHLNQLPFVKQWTERLPVNVSLFYYKADNFQPQAQRVDIYGEPLAAPSGTTHDRGILLETKDGKYSLKINKYETALKNASSTAIEGSWFIGSSQAWAGNWANIFEFNLGGDTIQTQGQGNAGRYTYGPAPGENQAQADAREAAAIAAWRTWQQSVDPRFYQAWGINLNDLTRSISASTPAGFTVPEDSFSEGYEIELNAQPTRNWRIAVNATKMQATRRNVGGAALTDFVNAYENALRNTAAGDLRIWWGGAGNETTLFQWNNNFGSNWAARKLQEGTNVPELREWRFNVITNYDFREGFLRGFNVGGGLRWQDEIVIGYPPIAGSVPGTVSFDLSKPYFGPSETNVDLWVGYGRKLREKLDWRIQLNIRNAFAGDDLIPITVQPDGSPGGFRIAPYQTWTLSNTFRF